MLLGVFAGLSVRVVDFSHSHGHEHHHASEHGSPCHGHPDSDPDDPGGDCPPGEHHHHACCLSLQLVVEGMPACRLPAPDSQRLGLQSLRLVPPDGPSFDLDKPPLI